MRKLLLDLALVVMVCTTMAYGAQVEFNNANTDVVLMHQDQSSLTMNVEIGQVNLVPVATKEGSFVMLAVNGFARSYNLGQPDLPVVNRLISIPFGCQLGAEVISAEYEEFSLSDFGYDVPVMPSQPSLSKSDDPDYVEFVYDRQAYAKAGYVGQPLVQTSVQGVLRAHRLGKVTISPFEYDPVTNKVKVYTNVQLRVDFINADWLTTEQTQRRLYSPFYEVVYRQLFNYNDDYPVILDDLVTYPVNYLIVSDRMFEAQLQPFIEWKTKKGFNVMVAYTDEIGYNNTQIAAYIEDLYNNETLCPSFVLLVGDDQQIPAFDLGAHISDLDFCEYTGDYLPEIYYGRWSAQNPGQLQPQIDKTLEYEMYTMPDPSYLGKVTLIAGVDAGHAPTWGNGQINYGTDYYFNSAHGIEPYVYLYPHSDDPVEGEIIQQMNDGIGMINYSAHCGHDGFSDPSIESSDIRNLTNEHKYMLGIGNCCESNTFGDDYSSPCFGEVWLQEEGKGGIGYIGGSNSTYWDEDYWWGVGAGPVLTNPTYEQTGKGAYDGLFHDHSEPMSEYYVTNDALIFCGNLAVVEGGSSRIEYYWEIYHLMGDPSIMSYMGVPTENNITHDPVIMLSAPTFTVSADPGSYVGISMDGELHGQGHVNESGSVEIYLTPFDMPGTADLVITAQNKQPYISTVTVITPSGPYVVFDTLAINDANGNNNGTVEIGESIQLDMRLVNVGPDDASNVSAVISTDDEMVTITDDNAPFGTITGDFGTALVEDAFGFDVASDCPDGHNVRFTMTVTGTAADEWTSYFTIPVHAPELQFVGLELDDSQGNGDGIIDPGETVEITVTIMNTGSAVALTVDGELTEDDEYVSITQSECDFGDIQPEGTANNSNETFVVVASEELPVGHSALFTLNLTEGNGYTTSMNFSLTNLESFEYSDGNYTPEGVWQWGVPTSGPGAAYDGEKVWGTVLDGEYPDNADDDLVTPYLDINMADAYLSFYHWYDCEEDYDGGQLLVSIDGSSWSLITPNSGYSNSDVSGLDGTAGFSGSSGGWEEVTFDLSAYYGQTIMIRFRFGADHSNTDPGWYIDAVVLYGASVLLPEGHCSETSFNVDLRRGENTTRTMNLSNTGTARLDFDVMVLTDLALNAVDPGHRYQGDFITTKEGHIVTPQGEIKRENDPPFNDLDVITSVGGPDGFGYTFIDSDEPSGPTYNWIDISGAGTPIDFIPDYSNPIDDGHSEMIYMGMQFEYYGNVYTDVQVSTNGWISFNQYESSYLSNAAIPTSGDPNNVIAVMWDDLDGEDTGTCYYYYDAEENRFIVSWVNWQYYVSSGVSPIYSVQVILDGDDNSIVTQYGDVSSDYQTDISIGVENEFGDVGLQYAFDNGTIVPGLAIKFKCPLFWLGVTPGLGYVMPDQSMPLEVFFDAAELEVGTYYGEIRMTTNDPVNRTMAVPCTLNVGEVGVDDYTQAIPTSFSLSQNYPNPFNPTTEVAFGLPTSGHVSLEVYDVMGRVVTKLVDGELNAGYHKVIWDGTNNAGDKVTSGVYFYRLSQADNTITKKMIMLK